VPTLQGVIARSTTTKQSPKVPAWEIAVGFGPRNDRLRLRAVLGFRQVQRVTLYQSPSHGVGASVFLPQATRLGIKAPDAAVSEESDSSGTASIA
jgi:hypothetical protein